MIITCEQCQTRFQLDDSRIPARGARVRCSRCKHAFFVRRPGAGRDEVVEEVVAEATGPGRAPAATADLPGPGDTDPGLSRSLDALGGSGDDDEVFQDFEEDWEFNEDPPADGAEAGRGRAEPRRAPSPRPEPRKPAPAPRPEPRKAAEASRPPRAAEPRAEAAAPRVATPPASDPELDALGSPDEWDFLADDGPRVSPPELPPETSNHREEPVAETPQAPETAPRAPARPGRVRAPRAAGVLVAVGWAVSLALLAAGLGQVVRSSAAPPAAPALARVLQVGGLSAVDVRAQLVENAVAGPMLVVRGRLELTAPGALPPGGGLRVQLVSATGQPLAGATAWAGPGLDEAARRELAPRALREAQESRAGFLAGAMGAVPFEAVFAEVPEEAADFVLEGAPTPLPPPSTASSPPSPPPSSE